MILRMAVMLLAVVVSTAATTAATTAARADNAQTMQAVYGDWMLPHATALAASGQGLTRALQTYCKAAPPEAESALTAARAAWRDAVADWERLSAVAVGPVLDYRMQSRIDLAPTRPRMITKAIESSPSGADGMDRVGTPAKGFPALEWLLWSQPVRPDSPGCRYAVEVAMEIERETQIIVTRFREDGAKLASPAAADKAVDDFLNQWVGGLDHLRWADMEKPVRKAATGKPEGAADYPRSASGATAASWAARWQALAALAAGKGPGSLAALLRDRGQDPLAQSLSDAVQRANAAMTGVDTGDPTRVLAATRELTALKALVEDKVAPALNVHIGFSDADGD